MRLRFESIKPSCVSGICRLVLAFVAFVPMGVTQEGLLPSLKDLGIVGDEPAEVVLKCQRQAPVHVLRELYRLSNDGTIQ